MNRNPQNLVVLSFLFILGATGPTNVLISSLFWAATDCQQVGPTAVVSLAATRQPGCSASATGIREQSPPEIQSPPARELTGAPDAPRRLISAVRHAHHRARHVEVFAQTTGYSRLATLGYVMAHEIGHPLLGTNSHTPHGIMRASWTQKELLGASAGRFVFFPQQAAKMQADVRKRIKVAASATLANQTGRAEERHEITVRVFNYAEVSSTALAEAEGEAKRIFERVGLAVAWIDCLPPASQKSTDPACEQPLEPTHIVLRILAGRQLGAAATSNDIGSALVPSLGGRGAYANIYFDRVDHLARGGDASRATILGHAMAHEIGHLLVGTAEHSSRGIMRAKWEREDLRDAARRSLLFDSEQAASIRREVAARRSIALNSQAQR